MIPWWMKLWFRAVVEFNLECLSFICDLIINNNNTCSWQLSFELVFHVFLGKCSFRFLHPCSVYLLHTNFYLERIFHTVFLVWKITTVGSDNQSRNADLRDTTNDWTFSLNFLFLLKLWIAVEFPPSSGDIPGAFHQWTCLFFTYPISFANAFTASRHWIW